MKPTNTRQPEKRSIFGRTFCVLEYLAHRAAPVGAQDVADALNINLPTTLRLLTTLVWEGLAAKDERTRQYAVGPAFFRLAALAERAGPLEGAIRPALRRLVSATGDTACFNLLQPSQRSFSVIAVEEGLHPLRYVVEIGGLHALHAGAGGKAILAFLPETAIQSIVTAQQTSAAKNKKKLDVRRLMTHLAQVRQAGYALTFGERVPGAVGLAAPVFAAAGAVVGSIQITVPEHDFRPREERQLAKHVTSAAQELRITQGVVPQARAVHSPTKGKGIHGQ